MAFLVPPWYTVDRRISTSPKALTGAREIERLAMREPKIDGYDYREDWYTELRVLILYSLYTIALLIGSLSLNWERWILPVILAGAAVAWAVFWKQYKTYRYRSCLVTAVTMLNLIIHGIHTEEFVSLIPVMGAIAVLLAIYGVAENIYIVMGCSVAILLHHIFYVGDMAWKASILGNCRQAIELLSAFIIEYLAWYLVSKQIGDKQRLFGIIGRMESAEQSKNDFLANMSHELRTPINTVTGMSELILQRELPGEMREEIFDIQIAGRGLLSIISDVLDYTELESGHVEVAEEPYNIISTINDVINMALAQNQEKNLELIVDCDATVPAGLMGDEQKIRRVMSNLVGNAIKFTQKGGVTITISYRKEEYGINLFVRIKDTGIGMEQQEMEKMFYGFYQADARRTRKEEGVGLGLAICNGLIRRMGGFLTVRSTPGKGSELSFVLPQKVLDETPAIFVEQPQAVEVICYFDMERFSFADIRDDYVNSLRHMEQTLAVPMHICRNKTEFVRRVGEHKYTHVFTGSFEYHREPQWYEELAEGMIVTVITDRAEQMPAGSGVGWIYKPFYALSIANVINGNEERTMHGMGGGYFQPFVAPEAKVLIVDDNLMNLKVAEGLLLQYKLRIATATSGEEALVKIETMDYDFVFMDHMMPGMDGVETLHRIRQKPGRYYQTVPVIALTANAIGGAREMFLQEGFQDFVAKPIDMSVLERVLGKFIPETKKKRPEEADGISSLENSWKEDRINRESTSVEEVAAAGDGLLADLEKEGICLTEALEYFGGDREAYAEIAGIYCDTADEKMPQIEACFEMENWEEYVVLVHAVKSTSLNIGAVDLSEMAKKLEFAGKEGRIEEIRDNHAAMMEEYRRVVALFRKENR